MGHIARKCPKKAKVYEYLIETPAGTRRRKRYRNFSLEDCDERLSSEAVDALIETVERIIPIPPEKPQEEDEVREEDGEG
ncbi:hypothetical protein R1flu_015364 [Riccia fluitans]|uniref:Uncharacterized protein n=1 Tax=Riccia fluitans TaxID=41844 RepID=A0ABD1YIP3_9MARC